MGSRIPPMSTDELKRLAELRYLILEWIVETKSLPSGKRTPTMQEVLNWFNDPETKPPRAQLDSLRTGLRAVEKDKLGPKGAKVFAALDGYLGA
jgi:hypothetical protein